MVVYKSLVSVHGFPRTVSPCLHAFLWNDALRFLEELGELAIMTVNIVRVSVNSIGQKYLLHITLG